MLYHLEPSITLAFNHFIERFVHASLPCPEVGGQWTCHKPRPSWLTKRTRKGLLCQRCLRWRRKRALLNLQMMLSCTLINSWLFASYKNCPLYVLVWPCASSQWCMFCMCVHELTAIAYTVHYTCTYTSFVHKLLNNNTCYFMCVHLLIRFAGCTLKSCVLQTMIYVPGAHCVLPSLLATCSCIYSAFVWFKRHVVRRARCIPYLYWCDPPDGECSKAQRIPNVHSITTHIASRLM